MAKKKILIVDDAAFMRKMLKDILTKAGYETIEAQDGEAAIWKYQKAKPDMVLMDVILPGMTGIEAVEEIIKTDSQAKILMVTAIGQQVMVIKALQLGAKDYIIKPFTPEKLIASIQKILGAK